MSFRSPWEAIAQALPGVGQAIARGIEQRAALQRQDEQQFRQSQQSYRNAITEQLANPDLQAGDAQRLRRQLQLVNEATSIDDLDALGQQLEATQLTPGATPSLESIFSATTGAATSTQGEIARAARGSAIAGREREEALAAYQDVRSVLASSDVSPEVKQNFLNNFLTSGGLEGLPEAQKGTLAALAGFADPVALERRALELQGLEARTEREEIALEIDRATKDAAITQIRDNARITGVNADRAEALIDTEIATAEANLRRLTTQADLDEATLNDRIEQERIRTRQALIDLGIRESTANAVTAEIIANSELVQTRAAVAVATQPQAIEAALAEYRVTIDTADDLVRQAALRTQDLEEGIQQRAESHAQNMTLGENRITLLEDQIEEGRRQAGRAEQAFEVEMSNADLRAIQAAIDIGTDSHLNDRQRQALADYFGTTVGSEEYVTTLETQRNNYLAAVQGQLRAEALAGDRAAAALAMDEQSLKTAQLQFDVTQYQFDRAQRLDPLEDARVFQASLAEATWAGDTQTVQRYLTILENPDMAPEQAQALRGMGYTEEGLREALALSEGERDRIREDQDLRIQVAREQVTALSNENNMNAIAILDDVSQYYQTPDEVEADRARLTQGRGGLTNDEVDLIKSKVAVRYGLFEENEAAKKLDTFSQIPPESTPEGEAAWRSSFVGLAMESGYERPEAEAMADGLINAYRLDDSGTRAQIRLAEMRADELERALNANPDDPTLGVTTSEFLSGLRLQESVIERQQAMNGCIKPENIGDIIVDEAIRTQAIQYWNEHSGDSETCRALAQDTQDIAVLTARVTGWVPSGGVSMETPSGTTTPPMESPESETPAGPETRTVFSPVTGQQTVNVNGQTVTISADDMSIFNEFVQAGITGDTQGETAYADMLNDAGYPDNVINAVLDQLYRNR